MLQDSSLYLIGNVASLAAGFLALPFYSRFLDPAQYGVIELVELSTQTVALAFGFQAIGAALSRLFHDQRSPEAERAVVSTALIATAVVSAAVTGAALAWARPLSVLVFNSADWTGLLRAAFVAMFFGNMAEVALVHERIRDRARFFLMYSLAGLVLGLSLNVLFIGVLGAGVWGFVASKLVVTVLGCAVLFIRVRRDVGWHCRWAFVPGLVRIGAPLVVSALAYFAVHYSDRFFLSHAVPLAEIGRYALAYRFAFLVSAVVGDSFVKSWDVTLFRYTDAPGWREDFARVAAYFTFVVFLAGIGVALLGPEVLRIMVPPDFLPPPWILPILVLAYLVREIGDFFRSLLLINKRAVLMGKIATGTAVVNLVANALLIPRQGVYGAACATLVTWTLYMAVCWVVAHREHRLPVSVWAFARLGTVLAATYAAAQATRVPWLVLQVGLDLVWSLVFAAAAFAVFFNAGERAGAARVVRGAVAAAIRRA